MHVIYYTNELSSMVSLDLLVSSMDSVVGNYAYRLCNGKPPMHSSRSSMCCFELARCTQEPGATNEPSYLGVQGFY